MKKPTSPALVRNFTLIILLASAFGCASISSFDQYAYTQTTSLKVDMLNTMDLAVNEYKTQEAAVEELQTKLQKAYEYERNRPGNEVTLRMWDVLLNPEGHLAGGFLKRWEKEGKLNKAFIDNDKKIVSDAFDQIAGLESHKIKPSEVTK